MITREALSTVLAGRWSMQIVTASCLHCSLALISIRADPSSPYWFERGHQSIRRELDRIHHIR